MALVNDGEAKSELEKTAELQEAEWKKKPLKQKLIFVLRNVTVEPIFALFFMPRCLSIFATMNLYLEKACRVNLNYSVEVCDALSRRDVANFTMEETQVQHVVASMGVWRSAISNTIPLLLILFMGSWADRHGRKICMIVPIAGEVVAILLLILCVYFTDWPMEVPGVIEAVLPSITGGWHSLNMAIQTYIADVTSEEIRTFRMGIVNFFSLGIPITLAVSGIAYVKLGFYGVFFLTEVMYVLCFVYIALRIKDVKVKGPKKSRSGILREIVDVKRILETFKVTFKKREGTKRLRIIFLIMGFAVIFGPMSGEHAVFYFFARYRFNWNEVEFSLFGTYRLIFGMAGTLVSAGLFSYILKVDDSVIGLIACASQLAGSLVYAFSTKGWMMYIAPVVDMINGSAFLAMRSIISKLVPSNELGKVNSIIGVVELITGLVFHPLYNEIYARTLTVLPGAFFLVGGVLTVPPFIMFIWLYTVHRKERKMKKDEETEEKDKKEENTQNTAQNEDKVVDNNLYIPTCDIRKPLQVQPNECFKNNENSENVNEQDIVPRLEKQKTMDAEYSNKKNEEEGVIDHGYEEISLREIDDTDNEDVSLTSSKSNVSTSDSGVACGKTEVTSLNDQSDSEPNNVLKNKKPTVPNLEREDICEQELNCEDYNPDITKSDDTNDSAENKNRSNSLASVRREMEDIMQKVSEIYNNRKSKIETEVIPKN